MILTRFYDALLTVAYPQTCLVCGGSVEERQLGVACRSCWDKTRVFTGAETICWKCGALSLGIDLPAELTQQIRCHRCDAQSFSAARAVGVYENALRASVLSLKRQPHVSSHLINLLVDAAQREPLNKATRIIPVPLHENRQRERGFNQASVIAVALSKQLQLPLDEATLLRPRASEKYRAGLDPKGRRDTVAGAFEVRYPKLIEGESVLLVDDVFTTGATVNSCAEALLASDACNVFVLTIARGKS
ncbi:MAG TPA: double zinc ribbon domain-containing protein [Pyrinomonadaceae bacterium]|nr:double zinc ribbon domain-containing protein [Pyrinomonadaceae bacterium]